MNKFLFKEIVRAKEGFLRGPFGGALKKDIFVQRDKNTYKVYEQGVVLNKDQSIGRYFISGDYFNSSMSRFEVKPNDFLVSCSGVNYGAIFQLDEEAERGIINQALLRIRLNNDIVDDDYFYYYFQYFIVKKITGGTGDSTIPNFPPMEVIKKVELNLPSLSIQKKIGTILSILDRKIILNNKVNKELETLSKIVFDYWFVQFDFPDKNGKPYKSSNGKMTYNKALDRALPEGWTAKSLNYFIATDKSGDWGKEQAEGDYTTKVDCIRGADINWINGKGEMKTPTRFILEKNGHKILIANDLVIEISGGSPTQSTGRLACVTAKVLERFGNPVICSNFCKAVSLISEDVVFYFTHSWNKAYDSGVFFGFEGKTSGLKNLLFDSLVSHYQIPLPDKRLLEQFQDKISLFEKQKQTNLKQNQELAALRDWLLPMLMNGQVTVGDLELDPIEHLAFLNKTDS